jgi:hypothetical protein
VRHCRNIDALDGAYNQCRNSDSGVNALLAMLDDSKSDAPSSVV